MSDLHDLDLGDPHAGPPHRPEEAGISNRTAWIATAIVLLLIAAAVYFFMFRGHREVVAPSDELVAAIYGAPKPPPTRLTFTYKLLNAAANVLFLVGGADKAATLQAVLRGAKDVAHLPAQGVQPAAGAQTWLVEASAASQL